MNHTRFAPAILGLVALALLFGMASCMRRAGLSKDGNVDYYTCTMHPSVRSQDPKGKCPICSMNLVPVMKKGANSEAGHEQRTSSPGMSEFSVPVERQQQIGVTFAEAKRLSLHHTIRSVGFIVPDKSRHWEFVARVEGYVQKLEVYSPGEVVEQGQPLLTLYSPDLLTTEREFVNLLQTRDRTSGAAMQENAQRLIDAAKLRMKQWNISDNQVADLEKNRNPSEFLTLYSPFKGVVEDVPVHQGRKVMTGDHLVDVADLSVVWAWVEFYENELSVLQKGQAVAITSKSYPGQKFDGRVGLINPFLSEATRTSKVRIDIPNPDLKLKPGMYVDAELAVNMGEGLAVPVSAVMPTGTHNLVFVDKGAGRLEPRLVQLGGKFGDIYKVLGGVKEGERVVASANFLIDAESKVQGAVKLFEETATDTMAK